MNMMVKVFFRTVRLVVGPVMLLGETLTRPRGLVRSPDKQRLVDEQCKSLALYQFQTCPFCIKVRHEMARLSLNIELRDAKNNPEHRDALLQGGGAIQAPCLRITDEQGQTRWMYESGDIIRYLRERFAHA